MSLRYFAPLSILCIALLTGALVSQARQDSEEPLPVKTPAKSPAKPSVKPSASSKECPCGSTAVVDMYRLYAESGAHQELDQRMGRIEADVAQQLKQVLAGRGLSQTEFQEYGKLLNKREVNEAEKTRINELQKLAGQRAEELRALQAKPEAQLAPADKTRLNELVQAGHFFDQVAPLIQEDMGETAKRRVEAFRQEQIARLRVEVGKTAKTKGMSYVFDSNALVYSAEDLTQTVLQRLPKRADK